MPKALHRLADKLKSKGMEDNMAWGTATNILKRQGKLGAGGTVKKPKKRKK
jgi:hypothetical protein